MPMSIVKNNTDNTTSKVIYRGCKPTSFCNSIQSNGTKCSDCKKDKCNDASGLSTSVATMVVTAAGVLIISRF